MVGAYAKKGLPFASILPATLHSLPATLFSTHTWLLNANIVPYIDSELIKQRESAAKELDQPLGTSTTNFIKANAERAVKHYIRTSTAKIMSIHVSLL
jgi:hypothetical protein